MTFEIDEAYLPATLSASQMSDEEFAAFCAQYPDYFIETTAAGEIVIMPPNYPLGSFRAGEVFGQLRDWNAIGRAGLVMDGTGGYVLPNGSRRSPDAAWVAVIRLRDLDRSSLERYWHFCPEFVVEVRSATDRLPQLRAKMGEWVANGAVLAWLIDPERKAVEIYRPGEEPEIVIGAESIAAGQPVEGFTLQLARIWDPLATS
jgi:Uma2 family endonuclease